MRDASAVPTRERARLPELAPCGSARTRPGISPMLHTLSQHWHLYLIEGSLLGVFMIAACLGCALLWHPGSPVARRVRLPLGRRAIMGAMMGAIAVALMTSRWGRLSGAHMNPATTLTFVLLGKVSPVDGAWYAIAQFVGGFLGVGVARLLAGHAVSHELVQFALTRPGPRGALAAFATECTLCFILMTVVLVASNHPLLMAKTPALVGVLVMLFITFAAPLSGMSINPARTLASALHARRFSSLWVYMLAPPLGMLAGATLHTRALDRSVHCAKLDHSGDAPCFFRCDIETLRSLAEADTARVAPASK